MTMLTFTIPANLWLSANDRLHWKPKSDRTKALRQLGRSGVTRAFPRNLGATHVAAFIGYPTNAKADPANAAPTVKALIDGLVDGGVWADDDSTHVLGPTYLRDPSTKRKGIHTVRLVLTSQEIPWLTDPDEEPA